MTRRAGHRPVQRNRPISVASSGLPTVTVNATKADDDGTPTSTYGEGFKAHLLTQNPFT
ncbi:hypothetical protein [Nonomuraea basaltis]|uniref:hypothetical protein n=1 Tax=Nonomuraea basaltis TaxID=2495887 RepID=UPI001486B0EA|nr:hypothetical protein [Nonomuraea basaltis]